jgi:putative ABC transport system permease protein
VSPTVYLPLAQYDQDVLTVASMTLSARSSGDTPARLAKSVVAAIGTINPNLALTVRPLPEQINQSRSQERVVALLSGFFGALALLLAGLGHYGVTSHAVSRRRSEFGIRMALGAAPGSVVRLVLSRVFVLVTCGIVIGGVASVWVSGFVATLLYGLEPRDG